MALEFMSKHKIFIIISMIVLLMNYVATEVLWYLGYFGILGTQGSIAYIALDILFKGLLALFSLSLAILFVKFNKTKQG